MTKPLKRLLNPKNVNPRFTKQKKEIIKPTYEAVPYSKDALANDYYRAKGQVAGNLSLADLLRMKKSSRT